MEIQTGYVDKIANAEDRMATARAAKVNGIAKGPVLNAIERLAQKPLSKSLAIKAKCFECMGREGADSGWRRLVRDCTGRNCPLYAARPHQAVK